MSIGTAGGINKTTDGGQSWVKFNHTNEISPISGNFVVALNKQIFGGHAIMWAATVNTLDSTSKRSVSFSADSGQTWRTTLIGQFCHNLGFKDSIVYAVTDNGNFRSADLAATWSQPGTIYDDSTKQQIIAATPFYAVDTLGENVWFGGEDGAAYAQDDPTHLFGASWRSFTLHNLSLPAGLHMHSQIHFRPLTGLYGCIIRLIRFRQMSQFVFLILE